jgi:tetratricopeptide (TPR) repeat protein
VREVTIDAHVLLGKKYFAEKEYKKALDHFLLARVPDEEAGSARFGNRDIQVNYYIGLTYEAIRNNSRARSFYKLAAEQDSRRTTGIMAYYQGLGYAKLGNQAKAKEVFENMVSDGNKQIQESKGSSDFFALFGEREAENTRNSLAYTIRGLGYKGLGQNDKAEEDLKTAVDLSHGNLWANSELQSINLNL